MGVVFSIAVVLSREEVLADAANTGGGGCEEGGEVGGHFGDCTPTGAVEVFCFLGKNYSWATR